MELNRAIFNAGARFIAGSNTKNKKYPPGTIGFVTSIDNWSVIYLNLALIETIVIRRGKKGKLRVEIVYLSVPIFNIGEYNDKEKHADCDFIHIEDLPIKNLNIMEMDPLNFIGWSFANASLLFKLCRSNDLFNRWPAKDKHPMNAITKVESNFANNPSDTIHFFGGEDFRTMYINSMRKMQSTLLRPLMMHKTMHSNKIILAVSYLIWAGEFRNNGDYDKKLLHNIYCLSRKKCLKDKKAVVEMDKRRIEENKKKNRGALSYPSNMTSDPVEYDVLISNLKQLTKRVKRYGTSELVSFSNYVFK